LLRFDRRRKFVAAAELDHAWIDHLNGIDAALQFFSQSDHALAIEASDRLSATIDDQAKSLKQRLLAVVEIMQDVRDRLPRVN
jgi:hypothetical protein